MLTEVGIQSKDKQTKYAAVFNERAAEWLDTLNNFTDEELQKRPSNGSWSLSLLYDHVMKVAYTYQIVNAKKAVTNLSEKKGSKNAFGMLLLGLNFLPRITMRMETFPEDLVEKFTPEAKTKENLIKAFSEFIKEVNSQFNILAESNTNATLKHPMFGNLNAIEWLRLVEIHLRHHNRQKNRIIETIKL